MGKTRYISFLLTVLLYSTQGNAQEEWTTYFSYKNCFDIVETPEFMIGATDLGLIYFHKETASINVKNKNNGLSDSGITAIHAIPNTNTVIIGYENGNIDVIRAGKVHNIPDLKIESLSISKTINHFLSFEGRVFCSADFGILELDIDKQEISTTFIIGEEASYLKVFKTTVREDSVFAATEKGLLAASLTTDQLAFYQNWSRISQSATPYCDILSTPDAIIGIRGEIGGTCSLISFTENGQTTINNFPRYYGITKGFENQFLLASRDRLYILDNTFQTSNHIDSLKISDETYHRPQFRKALFSNNQLWLADWNGGMFYQQQNEIFEQLLPPGPASNNIFKVLKTRNALWTIPGIFGSVWGNAWRASIVSVLSDNQWTVFDKSNTAAFVSSNSRDLINMTVNPDDPDNVFIASWGNGVYEFDKNSAGNYYLRNHFVEANSGLHNYLYGPMDRYTKIWGLTFDDTGHLFIANTDVDDPIAVYNKRDSIWYNYDYGAVGDNLNKIGSVLIDDYDQKWSFIVQGGRGLFVFDDNNTPENQNDDVFRSIFSAENDPDLRNQGELQLWDENGEVLTNLIYCLAKDHNGYIWIGTDIGILIQYDPGSIFTKEKPVFSRIKVPRNDGSGLADYLLEGQRISAIAIDGANRKYIASEGNGFYIISEDGTKTVHHYTTTNSPLPSNNVTHIHIDEESGEVFLATSRGLVSMKGEAIQGADNFSEVYVYPNPVRPSYEGNITITGLMDRTTVKITDTAGNLVYESLSLGGKALWNGKNLWGEKVKPGIYIVFLSTPDGSMSEFTKIAFVR